MLSIGGLAKKTGTKVQTIRYYEQIGLLPEPDRTEGGQRRYSNEQLDKLSFIRHSRQLGFSLEAIRELLDLWSLQASQVWPLLVASVVSAGPDDVQTPSAVSDIPH